MSGAAQSVVDELRDDVRRAAGMHYVLPVTTKPQDTPPPGGKKPFYINHYGCPSAYYLERPEYYNDPYGTLSRADSLGKLTSLGRLVLEKVSLLRNDSKDKTGELTEAGKQQAREIARQLVLRFPEMFADNCQVDGRSIVENHCLLTLGEATLELSRSYQPLKLNVSSSRRYQSWMNPEDSKLEDHRQDSLAMARYADFTSRWAPDDMGLMMRLFNDADYVRHLDAAALSCQLFDLAGSSQYAGIADQSVTIGGDEANTINTLFDIFPPEDIHRHWMRRNAWAYIRYGGCTLNGGNEPYTQRRPLWNLIHMGDSVMNFDCPVIHLRYTHESVVMSLICLLELDDYGLQTDNLDSLEALGWVDYRIVPLGGSMMIVHYRTDRNDPDPIVRILLNGHDARLPIKTDCAPYYHWQDVKRYYLRKLYAYARENND